MSVITPLFDKRSFNCVTLDNLIKYVIVNDPLLDKTCISVHVKGGSYDEPPNYDGVAHFLEHMLFMGSTKYPKEIITIGLTGHSGGKMGVLSNCLINVPSTDTPRIQEAHIMIGHIICELVESKLF